MSDWRRITDVRHRFVSAFDPRTGLYLRSGILDDEDRDSGVDPVMASFPHLLDVGIMGHCEHGRQGLCLAAGVQCYQSGPRLSQPNMTVVDFAPIARQCRGRTFQFALGGRGDPDQHESFADILFLCQDNDIVPNFTTSGLGLTPELARLSADACGAVAVSWYRSPHTDRAIDLLLAAGARTNIHYVLGNNSIDEAIRTLDQDLVPPGINAVVFLLHKPVGLGQADNVLTAGDPRVRDFLFLINRDHPYKIGFDSCTVPALLNWCPDLDLDLVDTCEGARFSAYVTPDLWLVPCSFDQERRWGVPLAGATLDQAWHSPQFDDFRRRLQEACPSCPQRAACLGGCPVTSSIVLCDREQRASS